MCSDSTPVDLFFLRTQQYSMQNLNETSLVKICTRVAEVLLIQRLCHTKWVVESEERLVTCLFVVTIQSFDIKNRKRAEYSICSGDKIFYIKETVTFYYRYYLPGKFLTAYLCRIYLCRWPTFFFCVKLFFTVGANSAIINLKK